MKYHVTWEIDIWTEDPIDAARQALEIQRDTNSLATVFDVTACDDKQTVTRVDLLDVEETTQGGYLL